MLLTGRMTDRDDRLIGQTIRGLRKSNRLSAEDLVAGLAEQGLDWSVTILSRVEKGDRAVKAAELPPIAQVLRANVNDVLGIDPFGARIEVMKAMGRQAHRAKQEANEQLARAKDWIELYEAVRKLPDEPNAEIETQYLRFIDLVRSIELGDFSTDTEAVRRGTTGEILRYLGAPDKMVEAWAGRSTFLYNLGTAFPSDPDGTLSEIEEFLTGRYPNVTFRERPPSVLGGDSDGE